MPSLYESTVNTGEVSSSNFTTLYNASGLSVPNAGAGQITGNLNVGGNLTVQGNTLLVGEVTLQSTLSLPNYTFPLPDGSTFQVLVTDGNGNLYWDDVSAIPGADYNISATTATGGANLTLANTAGFTDSVKFANGTGIAITRTDANTITVTNTAPDTNTTYTIDASATTGGANLNLVGSDSTTDTVKFAGGTNITVSQTDANTITISTIADDIPNGTAQGQVLYWNGSAWTASSNITSASGNDRLVVQYDNSGAGPNGALFLRKNYGATAYTTNDGIGLGLQLDSNSQTLNQIATINAVWKGSPSATEITLNTNTLDNAVGPFTPTATFSVAQAILPGDLAVNGGDISTLPGGIANLYNNNAVDTINIGNSVVTEVNIGNSLNSSRVQIKSPTIVGALATQAVFDTVATTVNAFGAATAVNIGAATGVTTIEHDLTVNGGNINLNGQAVAGTLPFITFEEQSADVNPLYGIRGKSSQNDPWFIGAGSTADDEGYLEIATGDNAGLSNSGGQIYVRQYNGATPLTGVPWYGGNGVVVNELILLDNIGNTTIPNSLTVDSGTLFVDATNNRVGVNDITPAYPLDVTGEIRATSNIRSNDSFYSDGDTIYLNYDKTDVNVNVNFGRVSPSTNAVIRWNSSSDSFEWSADGTTWYDFINANLTAPFYNGQLLSYLNGEWINENRVTTTDSNERNVFEYRPLSPIAGPNTSLFLRKDYSNAAPGTPGVGTYADGAGVSLSFQVDSDTQTPPGGSVGEANTYANITGVYSATVPTVSLRTSIDNGATAFTSVGDFTTAGATLPNDLAVNGGDITTTSATASLFNTNATTINIGNGATTAVRIGSSSGVVNIKSPSLVQNPDVGASTTFNLLNTITTDLNIGGAATTVDIGSTVSGTTTIGYDLVVNNDVSADSYIVDNISTYNTQTTNTSLAGTPVQISGTTRVSQKAIIKIIDNVTGEVHMLEALAFRSGTAGFLTTYAEMYSSVALATFTVTGTGGVTSILANPISSNSTTFTVARISLD